MGIVYNPFLDSEAGGAHRNHEVLDGEDNGDRHSEERDQAWA